MSNRPRKYGPIYAEAKVASVFQPTKRAIALSSDALKQLGQDLLPQSDLLYVKSVLVTAGMNANEDVFFVDELWNARRTPILKPLDWLHSEKDIVGVMYNVEARNLHDGQHIDMSQESYDQPFELSTEGVVYKLLFPDKAAEIIEKASAGELFVSMECWFDDYDYVLYNEKVIDRIIARNDETAFLDKSLKAFGGNGIYTDPNTNEDRRIGRGLRNIVFGGCGFVRSPANKRSVIEIVGNEPKNQKIQINELNDNIVDLLNVINNLKTEVVKEVPVMAEKKEMTQEEYASKIEELESKLAEAQTLQEQKNELDGKIQLMNASRDNMLSSVTNTFKEVVKVVSKAGIEVDQIEEAQASEADDAMKMKMEWFTKTMKNVTEKVKEKAAIIDELNGRLNEIKMQGRNDEINRLFAEVLDEEKVKSFIDHAKKLDDEEYGLWLDEKKALVEKIREYAAKQWTKKKEETEDDMKKQEDMKKKDNMKKSKSDNDEEDTEASVDESILDDVEVEDETPLESIAEEEEDNGMAQAIAMVYESVVGRDVSNKPGFDPVRDKEV